MFLRYIRAARRSMEEDAGAKHAKESIAALLKDVARKHTQAETTKGGKLIEVVRTAID